jgi:hypothetical protein
MRRTLLVLVAIPLVAAACGSSSNTSGGGTVQLTPAAYVKRAATKTSNATSEHMTISAVTGVQGQQVTLTGDGDFDNAKRSGTLNMHANVAGVDMPIDAILDGTTVYMRSPLLSATLPKGKTWAKIDLQKAGQAQGVDITALLTQSPTDQFKQLQSAGPMTKVGDETIDGVDTTHYRGKIDLTKLPQGAKIQALTKARYGPYDVWVGKDDGYIRRLKSSYSYTTPASKARQSIATTMTFGDFGKDVTITVPPDSETQTMGG